MCEWTQLPRCDQREAAGVENRDNDINCSYLPLPLATHHIELSLLVAALILLWEILDIAVGNFGGFLSCARISPTYLFRVTSLIQVRTKPYS